MTVICGKTPRCEGQGDPLVPTPRKRVISARKRNENCDQSIERRQKKIEKRDLTWK